MAAAEAAVTAAAAAVAAAATEGLAMRRFDAGSGSADVFALMRMDAESEDEQHHVFYGPQWWKDFVRSSGGHAFVAERSVGGEPLGFVAVEIRGGCSAYLAWLYVDKAWRRKGIGQALLGHALSFLDGQGLRGATALHVETSHASAIALYKSAGFRFPEDGPKVVRDHPYEGHEAYLMERRSRRSEGDDADDGGAGAAARSEDEECGPQGAAGFGHRKTAGGRAQSPSAMRHRSKPY